MLCYSMHTYLLTAIAFINDELRGVQGRRVHDARNCRCRRCRGRSCPLESGHCENSSVSQTDRKSSTAEKGG